MNIENIKATIEILKRQGNFDPSSSSWLDDGETGRSKPCSISSAIAASPEWAVYGGLVGSDGEPYTQFGGKWLGTGDSLTAFWGMRYADPIVYGVNWKLFVQQADLVGMPEYWHDMTRETAVSLFEQLLQSEFREIL